MSTRANIGVWDKEDDSIRVIYCHNDGYVVDGVGDVLVRHFETEEDANDLVDLGDLSFIYDDMDMEKAEELASRTGCVVQEINNCVAAVYTRGRKGLPLILNTREYADKNSSYRKSSWDIEYFYLFNGEEWLVACAETKWFFKPLATKNNAKGFTESADRWFED